MIPREVLQDSLIEARRENAELRARIAELEAVLKKIEATNLDLPHRMRNMARKALERNKP